MYLEDLSTSPLMRISTVKISWRVLAICILVLIVHSGYDISRINKNLEDEFELAGCGVNFYDLSDLNSFFILSLFALLFYGLIKLNKLADGWKQLRIEIYLSILIATIHLCLGVFQYELNIDWSNIF